MAFGAAVCSDADSRGYCTGKAARMERIIRCGSFMLGCLLLRSSGGWQPWLALPMLALRMSALPTMALPVMAMPMTHGGTAHDGTAHDGIAHDGTAHNDTAHAETAHNGTAHDGRAEDCIAHEKHHTCNLLMLIAENHLSPSTQGNSE